MDYDDIDVNMLDNRDSFGVVEMNMPKPSASPGTSNSERFSKRPPLIERIQPKRELSVGLDSKPTQTKFSRKTKTDVDQNESDRSHEKRNESKKSVESTISSDYKFRSAVTFQEKLSVLEDRDRHLRDIVLRNHAKNMSFIAEGTCPDMCPEKERLLREIHCSFSIFEGQIVQNEMHVVPELLVKEYARSSADQEEPLPHELRPEPVLIDTLMHLMTNIMPKIEETNVDVGEWYNFCWDRLRSLRKDIIQQQLCSMKIVELLEQSARFHISCFDRLFDCDRRIFDDKINAENLVNCLQMLITMYEDLEVCGQRCENECEFRIYMMLLLLDSGDLPVLPKWHDDRTRLLVEEVTQIYFAFKLNLYTKFFKLVKNTHYLNACILQRYFTTVRAHTLNTLANAYSSGSHTAKFPFTFVQKMLEIDDDEDTISFVNNYGFSMNYQTNEIRGSKSSFSLPETKYSCKSSSIIGNKRVPIMEAVTQRKNFRAHRKTVKVHSSFNEHDTLKEDAWNAEDQRNKVIELYGDIYKTMEHSTSYIASRVETDDDYEMPMESETSVDDSVDVMTVDIDESVISEPPPKSIFNFGSILPNKKIEDVVDAECKPLATTKSLTPPCSPRIPSKVHHVFTISVVEKSDSTPPVKFAHPCTIADVLEREKISPPKTATAPKEHVVKARKADEIVNSLTNAFDQFEQVYWNHFGVSESDRIAFQRLQTLKENRKLRRVVKNRLKRISARKAVRVWKRKVENRRKKEENFIGITHLPAEEYFRLWGTVRKHDTSNLVEEMLQSQNAKKWSRTLLNSKVCSIRYVGHKLAANLISTLRSRYARASFVEGHLPSVICWKLILTVPDGENVVRQSFVTKLGEFCRTLYYEDGKSELGDVQVICTNVKRVLTSVRLRAGIVENEQLFGVSHLIMIVNELWESLEEFTKRVSSTCERLSHATYLSLIIVGECTYKTNASDLISDLRRKAVISGFSVTKWKNFFTLPSVVFKACQHLPVFPSYRVKDLSSFVETIGNEFFTSLFYTWGTRSENSPIVFINLYNKFLTKLKESIEEEYIEKYNLSPEFLPRIVECEDARNNLVDDDVPGLITKYALISFTKWPPNSVAKMIKLLTKYCSQVENKSCDTLLPNVLRLLNVNDNVSVDDLNSRAPWLKIVELWSRYNLCGVSKNEDVNKVFVFYEEEKVLNVAKGLWIEQLLDN